MNCTALLLMALLAGQAPAKQDGILQPWEAKPVLDGIQKDTRSLIDALAQLSTEHWKGDYGPLLLSSRQRVLDIADALDRLARKPDSLVLAMEALLSMQHIEGNVDSLARGAERFQPTAVVPLDQGTNVFLDARGRMQTYVMDLSRYMERNLVSATNDLASCRDQLWKRPPPVPSPTRRR